MKMFSVLLLTVFLVACGSTSGPNPTDPVVVQPFDCQNPIGGIVKHSQSVELFKSGTVPFGQTCSSEVRTCSNGVLSGSATFQSCVVLAEQEPEWHEKPVKISDEGLKMGSIKHVGQTAVWTMSDPSGFSPKPPTPPTCSPDVVFGQDCLPSSPVCGRIVNGQEKHFSCSVKNTWKVFGWVYEKRGLDHSKMAEGVTVDQFWFAGCMAGMCDVMAGPVKTDKFGYFELLIGSFLDQIRLAGLPKYYAHCIKGVPTNGGGQSISVNMVNQPIGPFKQLLVADGACEAPNAVMKMFGAEGMTSDLGNNTELNLNLEPIK